MGIVRVANTLPGSGRGKCRARVENRESLGRGPKKRNDVIAIRHGFPAEEMQRLFERKEIALGGCVISGDDPTWKCNACGASFS